MKKTHRILVVLLAVAAASVACGPDSAPELPGTLVMKLRGYTDYAGQTVLGCVRTPVAPNVCYSFGGGVGENGEADILAPRAIGAGRFRIEWFIDADGSNGYTSPDPPSFPDPSWSREVEGNDEVVRLTFDFDTDYAPIDSPTP